MSLVPSFIEGLGSIGFGVGTSGGGVIVGASTSKGASLGSGVVPPDGVTSICPEVVAGVAGVMDLGGNGGAAPGGNGNPEGGNGGGGPPMCNGGAFEPKGGAPGGNLQQRIF
jgi:hypothetical protein